MTMAWTAQTGLKKWGLKVFIVVMFYAHERLGSCTAQQPMRQYPPQGFPGPMPDFLSYSLSEFYPGPLPDFLQQTRDHFCSEGCASEPQLNCGNSLLSPKPLCSQLCNHPCDDICWINTDIYVRTPCNKNQHEVCGYSDASVCMNDFEYKICVVYAESSESAFCICQDNPSSPWTRCTTGDDETNVATIVLVSLFALLLLLVIIGAVILCLHRQGRLPSFRKQTVNPAELSSVPLKARNSSGALPTEPTVPGSSMEYSYAYDHRPAKPRAKEDSNQDDHIYYSVGEGGYREGNSRYVSGEQRKIPATKELELDTSTDNVNDHSYFVLNKDEGNAEVGNENGDGRTDKVELTDSTTVVEPKETTDEDYTLLVPTGNPKSQSEQSGKGVATSLTSANECDVTSPIELPTERLSNGDAGTYFPLILSEEPKSPVEQSGYEDAKIPTSESHDATSPTGAQSISCDDNTYTTLVRTAEPKSQQEHSGNEAAIILNPGLATDSDDTSPYDHLDRKVENESKKGALSTVDVDDYQHLVNN